METEASLHAAGRWKSQLAASTRLGAARRADSPSLGQLTSQCWQTALGFLPEDEWSLHNHHKSLGWIGESSQHAGKGSKPKFLSWQKSRDNFHLPPPSLGKTVLMVWAVGLSARGVITSYTASCSRMGEQVTQHAAGGWRGVRTELLETKKPTWSGLHMSPSSHQTHTVGLTEAFTQPRQRTGTTISSVLSHGFTKQVTVRDLDIWIHVKKVSSCFESRFHPNVVQCKRVKKPCIYTYTSVCIQNVCTSGGDGLPARWGLLPKRSYGSDRLCPTLAKVSRPKQSARKLKAKRSRGRQESSSSDGCQLRPTAQTWDEEKEGRAPRGGMQEYKTQRDKQDACTRTDCTRTGMR